MLYAVFASQIYTYFTKNPYTILLLPNSIKTKINKLKQILGFMFQKNEKLQEKRQEMLTQKYDSGLSMLEKNLAILVDIYF